MRRLTLRDLLDAPGEIARFREVLRRGGVAAIPTETFYALAADPKSERGVSRIFEIKERDDGKPLLVLVADREQIEQLGVDAAPATLQRFVAIWPAPLTVVLPLRDPIAASRGRRSLAVRIPDSTAVRDLLRGAGPLTGTSANRSAAPPLSRPDDVARELPAVDLLVDGGATPGGSPSTIVDATTAPPSLLRAGAFAWPPATD